VIDLLKSGRSASRTPSLITASNRDFEQVSNSACGQRRTPEDAEVMPGKRFRRNSFIRD